MNSIVGAVPIHLATAGDLIIELVYNDRLGLSNEIRSEYIRSYAEVDRRPIRLNRPFIRPLRPLSSISALRRTRSGQCNTGRQ